MDYEINDDYLDDDDDGIMYSTKTYCSDSEEEFSFSFLQKSKRNSAFKAKEKDSSDDEDEFEKEMSAELQATLKKLTTPLSNNEGSQSSHAEPSYYDEIYFDSDEDDDEESEHKGRKDKHKVLSNDELFYDPLMDDADQAWVDNNRRAYQVKNKGFKKTSGSKPQRLPHSDAVLNCPACFTTLCLDCQRHEIYKNQYRAMFVFNCVVDKSEILHVALKENKRKNLKVKRQKKRQKLEADSSDHATVSDDTGTKTSDQFVSSVNVEKSQETGDQSNNTFNPASDHATVSDNTATKSTSDQSASSVNAEKSQETADQSNDTFNPVKCQFCNTKVAVQDQQELYHFFNVLASY